MNSKTPCLQVQRLPVSTMVTVLLSEVNFPTMKVEPADAASPQGPSASQKQTAGALAVCHVHPLLLMQFIQKRDERYK